MKLPSTTVPPAQVILKRTIARLAVAALGRRNLARVARALDAEARLDAPNDMRTNGEARLQREVVHALARAGAPITVLDVGANVGEWSESMLSECQRERLPVSLVAFEPSAFTSEILRNRLSHFAGKARLEQAALSDHEGSMQLYVAADGGGTNSLHAGALSAAPKGTETVRVTTLDSFSQSQGFDRIDLVKIDTEGNDLFVIRGATRMLREHRIGLIQFEYTHRWVAARAFLRDVFELVTPFGYRVGKVTARGIEPYRQWHHELENFREGNFVIVTPEWLDRLSTVRWWNE